MLCLFLFLIIINTYAAAVLNQLNENVYAEFNVSPTSKNKFKIELNKPALNSYVFILPSIINNLNSTLIPNISLYDYCIEKIVKLEKEYYKIYDTLMGFDFEIISEKDITLTIVVKNFIHEEYQKYNRIYDERLHSTSYSSNFIESYLIIPYYHIYNNSLFKFSKDIYDKYYIYYINNDYTKIEDSKGKITKEFLVIMLKYKESKDSIDLNKSYKYMIKPYYISPEYKDNTYIVNEYFLYTGSYNIELDLTKCNSDYIEITYSEKLIIRDLNSHFEDKNIEGKNVYTNNTILKLNIDLMGEVIIENSIKYSFTFTPTNQIPVIVEDIIIYKTISPKSSQKFYYFLKLDSKYYNNVLFFHEKDKEKSIHKELYRKSRISSNPIINNIDDDKDYLIINNSLLKIDSYDIEIEITYENRSNEERKVSIFCIDSIKNSKLNQKNSFISIYSSTQYSLTNFQIKNSDSIDIYYKGIYNKTSYPSSDNNYIIEEEFYYLDYPILIKVNSN